MHAIGVVEARARSRRPRATRSSRRCVRSAPTSCGSTLGDVATLVARLDAALRARRSWHRAQREPLWISSTSS